MKWWKNYYIPRYVDDIPVVPITRDEADKLFNIYVYEKDKGGRSLVFWMPLTDQKPYSEWTGVEGWFMYAIPLSPSISYTGEIIYPPTEKSMLVLQIISERDLRLSESK